MGIDAPHRPLPWSSYSDARALAREQELIFRRSWQYVGHAGQVAEPGSCMPVQMGDTPVVLVRGGDGELRAFLNVCRHRGSVLVDECAVRSTIQCPYHAWTYALDGTLRAAPRADREARFDRADWSLVELGLATWGPFVFVNPAPDVGPPLAEILGDIPEQVRAAGVDVDALVHHSRSDSSVGANWKISCENYLECYHCAVAHPGFSATIDVHPERYRLETARWSSSQFGEVREQAAGSHVARDGAITRSHFHFVWPNITINIFPGAANLSIGSSWPDGAARTRRFLDYCFAPDADPDWVRDLIAWDDQVGVEDRVLVERVQRGTATGLIPTGHLVAEGEQLVAHFQRLVQAVLDSPDRGVRPRAQ